METSLLSILKIVQYHFYAPLLCQAMVQAQERLQKKVQGFMFNMGFSGYYYLTGDEQENEGDKKILGTDLVI